MAKTRQGAALAGLRASVTRMQTQGERVVAKVRRDAQTLLARSRGEILKEFRALERKVVKGLHAASEEHVARLERRVAKLEQTVAELRRTAA